MWKLRGRAKLGTVLLCTVLWITMSGAAAYADSAVKIVPGSFALASNPATIGVGEPTFRLTVLPFDVWLHNNTWSIRELDKYLDKELTDEIKDRFLGDVPADGMKLGWTTFGAADLGVAGVSANLALRSTMDGTLSRDLLSLALKGNQEKDHYVLDGSRLGAAAYGDASLGLSVGLGENLRLGGRYHFLFGVGYADAAVNGEFVDVDGTDNWQGDVELVYTYAFGEGVRGTGAAFDLGVALQLTPKLAVGFAIMDIGQIVWQDLTREVYEGSIDSSAEDPLEFHEVSSEKIASLTWQLPRRYEASVGWQLSDTLHLGASYTHTIHASKEGFVRDRSGRGQAMLSWTGLSFLPLGVGAAYSADEGLTFSGEAGLKLGPLRSRLRLTDVQTLFGSSDSKELGFMLDFGLVF